MEALKEKILVIQTAFIGDAILTLPMLQELRKLRTAASIDIMTIPSTEPVFRCSPAVDDVLVLDKRGKHKSFSALYRFTKEIKQRDYSIIYSPHRSFRTSFIVLQSGVRETYGFSNSSLPHTYKYLTEYNPEDHEVKRNLDLIGAETGNDKWRISPCLIIPAEAQQKISRFIQENKLSDFICIAPGSIWKTKRYPSEYFKVIADHIVSKGKQVLLIGSQDDADLCDEITGHNKAGVLNTAGKFTIIETIELLKHAALLICNDSAPTHMAQCAGIPVLTLYCSTNASIGFYPYNAKSTFLSYDDLPCKPCGIHGRTECPVKTFACGYNLKPESVILKIEEMTDD